MSDTIKKLKTYFGTAVKVDLYLVFEQDSHATY